MTGAIVRSGEQPVTGYTANRTSPKRFVVPGASRGVALHEHTVQEATCKRLLLELRKTLRIPDRWQINLNIVCDSQMPSAYGLCQWEYISNAQYWVFLRCDLTQPEAEWILAHELMEAMMSSLADFTYDLIQKIAGPEQVKNLRYTLHGNLRNELIEWVLPLLLRQPRPETLRAELHR